MVRILRHGRHGGAVTIGSDGFASLHEVAAVVGCHEQDVCDATTTGWKQRFEMKFLSQPMSDPVIVVRATQGHSVAGLDEEALGHPVTTDPGTAGGATYLYHGTSVAALPGI